MQLYGCEVCGDMIPHGRNSHITCSAKCSKRRSRGTHNKKQYSKGSAQEQIAELHRTAKAEGW